MQTIYIDKIYIHILYHVKFIGTLGVLFKELKEGKTHLIRLLYF